MRMDSIGLPAMLDFASGHGEVLVVLAALVIATGIFWWWLVQRLAAMTPPPADPPAPPDAPAEEAPLPEGPGPLLVRFQELSRALEQTTKDLQRFNGAREVQLQGWQQICHDVIRRILPVLDNLQPYLDDENETVAAVAQLAHGRLLTELATVGVTRILPAPGEPFDGRYHQLGPETTGYPPYRITAVVSPGYLFTPRVPGAAEMVLKPAEVVAASCPVEAEAAVPAPGDPAGAGTGETPPRVPAVAGAEDA